MDHLQAKQALPAFFFSVNFKHHNMKPLLYIGAALMVGAGIYGFVDYKAKSNSREMQSLYTKELKMEVKELPPATDKPETTTVEPVVPVREITAQDIKVEETKVPPPPPIKKAVKNKKGKVYLKQFSRAALEEDMDEVPLPEPVKKSEQ